MEEGHYKDGVKDGLETQWYLNGVEWMEVLWKDGKEVSRKEF